MLAFVHRQQRLRVLCVIALLSPVVFVAAPLARVESLSGALNQVLSSSPGEWDDLFGAFFRTVGIALVTALFASVIGLMAALATVTRYQVFSRLANALLLLPFFLGQAVEALLARQVLSMNWDRWQTTDWPQWAALGLIAALKALRFGALFAVVFANVLVTTPRGGPDFVAVHALSRRDLVRDVLVPRALTAFRLCCCLAFAAAMVEDGVAALVFRASPGNGLELLDQWGMRQQQTLSLASPQAARDLSGVLFGAQFVLCLVLTGMLFLAGRPLASLCVMGRRRDLDPGRRSLRETAAMTALILFAGVQALGIVWVALTQLGSMDLAFLQSLSAFSRTLALGIASALVATVVAALLAVGCSLAWPVVCTSLTSGAVALLVMALLLTATPPFYLVLASHDWAWVMLEVRVVEVTWMFSHIVFLLPLLFAFFLVAHFAVRGAEVELQLLHHVPLGPLLKASYFRRFRSTYALGALCAFALIWNEHAINLAFSDVVPSFAAELQRAMQGRAANVGRAAACAVFSLLLGGVLVWVVSRRGGVVPREKVVP